MKPDYKNWMPDWLIAGSAMCTAGLITAAATLMYEGRKKKSAAFQGLGLAAAACAAVTGAVSAWTIYSHKMYSYTGSRQLSKQIVNGTADYIHLPENGIGLDIGCGSGALTIACAKRNPQGTMIGIDRWGKDYASFSKKLCERNAESEGVSNVAFLKGDAMHLAFEDSFFDAVTSNYVYHDLPVKNGRERQEILLEAFRVLKKGGTFAIHDLFSTQRYGDMNAFLKQLKQMGFEEVRLIPTDQGMFMSKKEASLLWCRGAALLVGKK